MGDAKDMRSTEEMNKVTEGLYIIPCKKNKCILLPVCQNKKHIDCEDIATYYSMLRNDATRDDTWNKIKETLKSMTTFRSGENGTDNYIYLEAVKEHVYGQELI